MIIDLKGKQALVCGSTQGIGKAIALQLAASGANVTLFARNEGKLKLTINELDNSMGQTHDYITADFHSLQSFDQAISEYCAGKNNIHILVNNSGGPAPGQAIDAKAHEFIKAFEQHLVANQIITSSLVPFMKNAGYGRIINVISTSVRVPIPGLGVSNTIRGSVASWAKTISSELASFGITVNNILPGLTKTGRLDALISSRASDAGISIDEMEKNMKAAIPAKRFAQPPETAALACFLASPLAAYITGESIKVDGGSTPSI